jgi:hypothetical protein
MAKPLKFPKGTKLAVEGGELQDLATVDGSLEDGAKTVHTHRNGGKASGVVYGPKSCKITFSSKISSEGFERDYLGKWEREESVQARYKFPGGKVITVDGCWTNLTWKGSGDDAVEFTCTIIGCPSFSG